MADRSGNGMRLIQVNEANIKHSHLYLDEIMDFFPRDCFGHSTRKKGMGRLINLDVEGFSEPILTDIPTDARTGRPRRFFRRRSWVGKFFQLHGILPGDALTIERRDHHSYRIRRYVCRKQYSAAEFFAGIGLVRLALERKGWRVAFANDIDPEKFDMYRANFGQDHFVLGDIHELSPDEVPTCDLFTASFPCNDLSIAGAWEGLNGRQSSAFWGFIDILKALGDRRPPFVLLENVVGFLQSHGGRDFESALLALNELGYSVDAFILNASHWTPQSRARLFVVAKPLLRKTGKNFALATDARPDILQRFISTHQHIEWDIHDLPDLPTPAARLPDIVEDLGNDDPRWWNNERAEYFFGQLSERHLREAEAMIRGRAYTYATAFRRVRHGRSMAELRTDGIAGCLRTPRGGSGRQILFKAGRGKYKVRLLTPRECARLQGVPDDFAIETSANKALFGFGDAVCVPAVAWIAEHYLTPLARRLCTTKQKQQLFA